MVRHTTLHFSLNTLLLLRTAKVLNNLHINIFRINYITRQFSVCHPVLCCIPGEGMLDIHVSGFHIPPQANKPESVFHCWETSVGIPQLVNAHKIHVSESYIPQLGEKNTSSV